MDLFPRYSFHGMGHWKEAEGQGAGRAGEARGILYVQPFFSSPACLNQEIP